MKEHIYDLTTRWTGNRGQGTDDYRAYGRDFVVHCPGKPTLLGSADQTFRGDPARYNPEEFLVAALSGCHMLSYLHLCADAQVVVTHYEDRAIGTMVTSRDGGGAFSEVVLHPVVTVTKSEMIEVALTLHTRAHSQCFISNSVNFTVRNKPTVVSDVPG